MNASEGREPARPQQGNGAGGAKSNAAAAQPRLSREAVVAFVLLPVLLAAGFFLGGRLLGDDSPTTIDAAPVDTTPDAEDAGASGADDPSADPGASPSEVPVVVGPPAPTQEVTEEPAPEPSLEPTEAPASPEPAPEPTEAPPAPEPTEAPPAPEPTEAPAPEPTQAPADPSQPAPGAPGLLTSIPDTVPQPTAGNEVLLFPGFAGEDVRTWQARMVERGWDLQVDGIYGERTAQVAGNFQAEKGLVVDGLVGPETWTAAWTTPIT